MKWFRVTRQNRCAICKHDSWCTYADIGAGCMRVESATPMRNGGWLHRSGDTKPVIKPTPTRPDPPKINCTRLMAEFHSNTREVQLHYFSKSLGVSVDSVRVLGVAWAERYHSWAVPMKDGWGNTIGIHLRTEAGKKFAVPGSHNGLFVPCVPAQETAWIVEGASDTCAGLSLGLFTLGRPSCTGGTEHVKVLLKRLDVRRAVVLADNDEPGLAGAARLGAELKLPVQVATLPTNDLRQFLCAGGTAELLRVMLHDLLTTRRVL